MNSEQLAAAAQSVLQMGQYLEELKAQTVKIFDPAAMASRGYITPSEEIQLRQLQFSYWKIRNALFEMVYEIRRDAQQIERATPQEFLVAFAAATLLVDAARFLRELFHRVTVVRRKLDEPDPVYGIPPRMYDNVQKSLTSPYHAWHLWQAAHYYDLHRGELHQAAEVHGLETLVGIIERLRERLRPTLWTYVRTRLQVRGRRAVRRIGRDVVGRGVYALQEALGRGMAEVFVRRGHAPSLPRAIRSQLVSLLRPGDVLVVRKEFAATNYFLPGYWPHVALFLGTELDLRNHGLAEHQYVQPRLTQLASATPLTAVLAANEAQAWDDAAPHPCVLEAMKDGVRIRSVNSPFNADSVVVVRPLLQPSEIAVALAQALMHEGKAYDFDFDFCASHRLVCTEVVYRAYDGIAGVQFELKRHVGRFALAAGDILRLGLARKHFSVIAAYSPAHGQELLQGTSAHDLVAEVDGR
jgi:hypothetical protein